MVMPNLVAITTRCRRLLSARSRIVSLAPNPYTSAVSNVATPTSSAASIRLRAWR
jgi:hypothetical protein